MDCGDSEESDPNRIPLDLRWIQQCVTQVRNAMFSSDDEILLLETAECEGNSAFTKLRGNSFDDTTNFEIRRF